MTKSANELSRDTDGTPKKSRIGQTVCPHRAMVASHEHRWSVPSEEEDDDEEDEEEEGDTCRAEMHWTRRDHEAYVPISVPPASSVHALGTASIAGKNLRCACTTNCSKPEYESIRIHGSHSSARKRAPRENRQFESWIRFTGFTGQWTLFIYVRVRILSFHSLQYIYIYICVPAGSESFSIPLCSINVLVVVRNRRLPNSKPILSGGSCFASAASLEARSVTLLLSDGRRCGDTRSLSDEALTLIARADRPPLLPFITAITTTTESQLPRQQISW